MKNNRFEHGGNIYGIEGLEGREPLDFSSNINPLGVPKSFITNIEEAVRSLNKYPDIQYRDLRKSICDYINKPYIKGENIVLGNGAAEIIDAVISSFKNIIIVVPSFAEYEQSALKHGTQIKYFYLNEDMRIDYEALSCQIDLTDAQALIVGNPNNPNGEILDKKLFTDIIYKCNKKNMTVVIDEAFIEFAGEASRSFAKEAEDYENLFIIRALTKYFGMPGIRFGYGLSTNNNLMSNIRDRQLPWNINSFAEIAAKYVLKDVEYIEKSSKWIKEELPYMKEKLNSCRLIEKVYDSRANFILCKLKGINCEELYSYCLSKGVLIRKCSNYRGLNDSYVRFAVKDRKSNDFFIDMLNSYI